MGARYLVRFDDLCPTMNWEVWTAIEAALLESGVMPILAVVPDNQDAKLQVGPAHSDFWGQVRRWQARGWTIGLHGYQHRYVTADAGLVGVTPKSEFAGLPASDQQAKLEQAMAIFRRERVTPDVWVAPSHSFDHATLVALKRVGLAAISDGFALAPHVDSNGMVWIPQQLWKFRWRPFGLWTVCYHHNRWTATDIARLRADLAKYRQALADLPAVLRSRHQRHRKILDDVYAAAHSAAISLRRQIRPTP